MKMRMAWALLGSFVAALGFVPACVGDNTVAGDGSIGDASVDTTSETSPADGGVDAGPPVYPRFAFVANNTDGTITSYTVDGTTGWLRLGGYSLATAWGGGKNARLAVDSAAKHLYAVSGSDNMISMFAIGTDGSLPFAGSTQTISASPASVALEPSGHYAYVASSGGVFQFGVSSSTGALTALSPASVSSGAATLPHALAIDPAGKHVYLAANDGQVYQYVIGQTGALTPMTAPTIAGGAGNQAIAIDPSGKHAYVSANGDNAIYQYSIDANGALAPLSPAKISTGSKPVAVAVDPTGAYAYVANHDDSSISQFTIDTQSGALTAMTPASVASGTSPGGVTIDPSGKFAYSENQLDDTVTQYAIGAGGALTSSRSIRTRDNPSAFVIAQGSTPLTYKPLFAYAANWTPSDAGANVAQYGIDTKGGLTPNGTAIAGTNARYVASNASGSFVYVSNLLSANVSQYSVGTTGMLSALNPASVDTTWGAAQYGPIGLAPDPNGRFAYVVNYYSNSIGAFSIASGKLTTIGSAVATGSNPVATAIDPTGRFVFVSNTDSSATGAAGPNTSISAYAINDVTTGLLTSLTTYTEAKGWCVGVDPTGKFAYVAGGDDASGVIYQYQVNTSGGLVALSPASVTTGNGGGAVMAFDPWGRYVYVINGKDNTISQYSIGASGVLQPLSPAKVSGAAGAIAVDISGQHAYVLNNAEIWQYDITNTGALTQQTPGTVADIGGTLLMSIATTGVIQ